MKKQLSYLVGVAVLLLVSACQPVELSLWQTIETGLERAVFHYESQNVQKNIVVYKIDQKYFSFTISNRTQPQTLKEWSEQLGAELIVNGGYFHEDFSPSGLLIVKGETVSTREFDYDKSGAVVIDNNQLQIVDLAEQSEGGEVSAEYAIQSYPFFIKNSQAAISQDSQKMAHRTVIGLDQDGFVYLIVTPSGDLSLYQLMRLMLEWPVSFTDVLNLDGGMSSGMVVQSDNWQEEIHGASLVPNVLSVHKKAL